MVRLFFFFLSTNSVKVDVNSVAMQIHSVGRDADGDIDLSRIKCSNLIPPLSGIRMLQCFL